MKIWGIGNLGVRLIEFLWMSNDICFLKDTRQTHRLEYEVYFSNQYYGMTKLTVKEQDMKHSSKIPTLLSHYNCMLSVVYLLSPEIYRNSKQFTEPVI